VFEYDLDLDNFLLQITVETFTANAFVPIVQRQTDT